MFFLCLTLSACGGGGNTVRYYLLDPVDTASRYEAEKPLALEIVDLHLPQYLERFQIVSRDGENRLKLSDANQWGENLRKNLLRTLSVNLAGLLSTMDISTPLNRSASMPDYRIHVHIFKFEKDNDDRVKLVARWQLSDANEAELGMHNAVLESPDSIEDGNYDAMVMAMQQLFSQISSRIAESIIEQENKQDSKKSG